MTLIQPAICAKVEQKLDIFLRTLFTDSFCLFVCFAFCFCSKALALGEGVDSLSIFITNIMIVGLSDHLKPRGLSETMQGIVCFLYCVLFDSHCYKQIGFL